MTMRDYHEFLGEILVTEDQLTTRITELGKQISLDYREENDLLLICILRGGVLFLTDLMREIKVPLSVEFMAVSSYGTGNRESTGHVRITLDLISDIHDRNVLVI